MNLIAAIDFDGTIVEHAHPLIGPEVPGAIYYLTEFANSGGQIILFTMRSEKELDEAVEFLQQRGVKLWGINENPDQESWTSSPKVYAQVYVDDAALGAPLKESEYGYRPHVDWDVAGPYLLEKVRGDDASKEEG